MFYCISPYLACTDTVAATVVELYCFPFYPAFSRIIAPAIVVFDFASLYLTFTSTRPPVVVMLNSVALDFAFASAATEQKPVNPEITPPTEEEIIPLEELGFIAAANIWKEIWPVGLEERGRDIQEYKQKSYTLLKEGNILYISGPLAKTDPFRITLEVKMTQQLYFFVTCNDVPRKDIEKLASKVKIGQSVVLKGKVKEVKQDWSTMIKWYIELSECTLIKY